MTDSQTPADPLRVILRTPEKSRNIFSDQSGQCFIQKESLIVLEKVDASALEDNGLLKTVANTGNSVSIKTTFCDVNQSLSDENYQLFVFKDEPQPQVVLGEQPSPKGVSSVIDSTEAEVNDFSDDNDSKFIKTSEKTERDGPAPRRSTRKRKLKTYMKQFISSSSKKTRKIIDEDDKNASREKRLKEQLTISSFTKLPVPQVLPEGFTLADMFECGECKLLFKSKYDFVTHVCRRKGWTYPYMCNICEKGFFKESPYQLHKLKCEEKPFGCTECGKRFAYNRNFLRHMQSHSSEASLKCDICQQVFSTVVALNEHSVTHSTSVPKKCHLCNKVFRGRLCLLKHLRLHKNHLFKCEPCNLYFIKHAFIKKHHDDLSHSDVPNFFNCENCSFKFSSTQRLIVSSSTRCGIHPSCDIAPSVEDGEIINAELGTISKGPKVYPCKACRRKFTSKKNFLIHSSQCRRKPFHCSICRRGFSFPWLLHRHHKLHRASGRLSCSMCFRSFSSETLLKKHQSDHFELYPYSCGDCGAGFSFKAQLNKHRLRHEKEKKMLKCLTCKKTFLHKTTFNKHMFHHKPRRYRCSVCDKMCTTKHQLTVHTRTHTGERPLACFICGKTFSDPACLYKHGTVHSEEKSFMCDQCGHSFNRKSTLVSHVRLIHAEQRTYVTCQYCGNNYSSELTMQNHVKRVHLGLKSELCSHCGKEFYDKGGLKRHLLTHDETTVDSITCSLCPKLFRTQRNLRNHMKLHSGVRPFKCSLCEKDFNRNHNLVLHMRTHTGEKPFQCDICGRCFSQKNSVNIHKRKVHVGVLSASLF